MACQFAGHHAVPRHNDLDDAIRREQARIAVVGGNHDAFEPHILRIQASIEQLIPCRANRFRQLSGAHTRNFFCLNRRREIARRRNAFSFDEITELRIIGGENIQSSRGILNHDAVKA